MALHGKIMAFSGTWSWLQTISGRIVEWCYQEQIRRRTRRIYNLIDTTHTSPYHKIYPDISWNFIAASVNLLRAKETSTAGSFFS